MPIRPVIRSILPFSRDDYRFCYWGPFLHCPDDDLAAPPAHTWLEQVRKICKNNNVLINSWKKWPQSDMIVVYGLVFVHHQHPHLLSGYFLQRLAYIQILLVCSNRFQSTLIGIIELKVVRVRSFVAAQLRGPKWPQRTQSKVKSDNCPFSHVGARLIFWTTLRGVENKRANVPLKLSNQLSSRCWVLTIIISKSFISS